LTHRPSGSILSPKGPKALRPAMFYVGLARSFEDTCYVRSRRPRWWRKSMEAAPPSQPATTWHQTDFSKSWELPYGPINTPLQWKRVDTPHFGDSTCKAPILSVVTRHSLVGRVVRL
jgi:hypothetical protein